MEQQDYLSSFVLVRFRQGSGRRTKKDATLTAETINSHGMADGQATVTVKYFADGEFEAIDALNRERRAAFKSMTVGWLEDSSGMIPVSRWVSLDDRLSKLSEQLAMLIAEKAVEWDDVISRASVARNGNFNPDDYPSDASVLNEWYNATWKTVPHPTNAPLSAGIAESVDSEIQTRLLDAQADMADGVQAMREEITNRLLGPLVALIDKCKGYEAAGDDDRARCHKSTFTHIAEAVEQIADFIPAGNEKLQRALAGARALGGLDAYATAMPKDAVARDRIKKLATATKAGLDAALIEVFA